MNFYVCLDGDNIGSQVGKAALADQDVELARMSHSINDASDQVATWIEMHHGQVISWGGDEIYASIPSELIPHLEDARKVFHDMTGFTISGGVAPKLSDAARALMIAKIRGKDRIVFWRPDMQDELDEAMAEHEKKGESGKLHGQYLAKAEKLEGQPTLSYADLFAQASAATQQQGQGIQQASQEQQGQEQGQPNQDQQLKAAVIQVLQQFKSQLPTIEQIKDVQPETYEAIIGMVQALAAMATERFAEPEQIQKSEQTTCTCEAYKFPHREGGGKCKPKLKKDAKSPNKTMVVHPPNMDGTKGYPPNQLLDGGRVKVMHSDLANSPGVPDPSNLSWRQMRAGRIMDSDGSALSARRTPGTLPTEKTDDAQ